MDFGRFKIRNATRWETIMGKLLDHSFPDAPREYDAEIIQRTFRDIEMALSKPEVPSIIEGRDENAAITWFFHG